MLKGNELVASFDKYLQLTFIFVNSKSVIMEKLMLIEQCALLLTKWAKSSTPTEIWTRVAGFKVQSANHYTIGAYVLTPSAMSLLRWTSGGQQPWVSRGRYGKENMVQNQSFTILITLFKQFLIIKMKQNQFNKFNIIKTDSFSAEVLLKLSNDIVNLKTLSDKASSTLKKLLAVFVD